MGAVRNAQAEWKFQMKTDFFLLFFYSIWATSLLDGTTHIRVNLPYQLAKLHASDFYKLTDTPDMCLTSLLGFLNAMKLGSSFTITGL